MTNGTSGKPGKNSETPSSITIFKDWLSVLKDLLIFTVIICLFFPKLTNWLFTNTGFEEINVGGFKWKASVAEMASKLRDAQQLDTILKTQLDKSQRTLVQAENELKKCRLSDPTLSKLIDSVRKGNDSLKMAYNQVQASVSSTISANAEIVQKAQETLNTHGSWGVVYSGDLNLSGAQYEVGRVAKLYDIPNAKIYKRQGMYRSVSVVEDLKEAQRVQRALKTARGQRKDAYIVSMSTWCSNSVQRDGYLECQ